MKRKFLLSSKMYSIFFVLGIACLSSRCVSKGGEEVHEKILSLDCKVEDLKGHIGLEDTEKWQVAFLNKACADKNADQAWALFQQGGITGGGDFGQTMVLATHGDQKMRKYLTYHAVSGAQVENISIKNLKQDDFASFDAKLKAQLQLVKTERWDKGSDMFEYEYVHLEKSKGTLYIKQRLKWRCGLKDCEHFVQIAESFRQLLK